MPTAPFSAATVCWLHRLLTEDLALPEAVRGRFRGVQVWIGSADSNRETAHYVPPPPEAVPRLVDEWLQWWHEQHRALRGQPKEDVVAGLAERHHRFLTIHPFMDANGRVTRSIADQAARELLNQRIGRQFIRGCPSLLCGAGRGRRGRSQAPPRSNQSCPSVSMRRPAVDTPISVHSKYLW